MEENAAAAPTRGPSFKKFWRKTVQKPLSFIQHDPSGKGKQKSAAKDDDEDDGEDDELDEGPSGKPSSRRQQVYRAQKLHRQRKAEYIRHLEQEIANLRKLDTDARKQKCELETQNNLIRQVLTSCGLSPDLSPSLDEVSQTVQNFQAPTFLPQPLPPSTTVSFGVHWDEDIGADRIFVQTPSSQINTSQMPSLASTVMSVPSPASSTALSSVPSNNPTCGSLQEYFSVLDFILALEHVCRDHTEHPDVHTMDSHTPRVEGHFLSTSTQVLGYAPSTLTPVPGATWEIPYAEIDKLIRFSEQLDLQEEITPVQAWQTLKIIMGKEVEPIVLRQLQWRLGKVVKCSGFGAVIDVDKYWIAVKEVTGRSVTDLLVRGIEKQGVA